MYISYIYIYIYIMYTHIHIHIHLCMFHMFKATGIYIPQYVRE